MADGPFCAGEGLAEAIGDAAAELGAALGIAGDELAATVAAAVGDVDGASDGFGDAIVDEIVCALPVEAGDETSALELPAHPAAPATIIKDITNALKQVHRSNDSREVRAPYGFA